MSLENEFIKAALEGNLEEIKKLIPRSSNIHKEAAEALAVVAEDDNEVIAKLLIDNGADIHYASGLALRRAGPKVLPLVVEAIKKEQQNA